MTLWQDIKYRLQNSSSPVNQIVLINVLLFAAVSLFKLLLFFFNQSDAAAQVINYLYVPSQFDLLIQRFWTLITYQFMHTGVFHILFNMLMFYFLGGLLYDFLGPKRVWQVYLAGGVFAAIVFIVSYTVFPALSNVQSIGYLVGASGSVMAITGATATLIPNFEVMLFGVFRIKLKWLALALIIMDIASIPSGNSGGGIAHLGGAFFGIVFILYIQGRVNNPLKSFLNNLQKFVPSQGGIDEKKIYKEKVYSTQESKKANARREKRGGKPNQAEIDAILDKISHSGYDSLTSDEKEILFRASE